MHSSLIILRHAYFSALHPARRVVPGSLLPVRTQFYTRRFTSTAGPTCGDGGETYKSEPTKVGASVEGTNSGNGVTDSPSLFSSSAPTVRRRALPPSDFPENALLKCIEKEIEDEALRLDKEECPPPPPTGWEMYHAPGTSVFYGRRWWLPATASAETRATPERHTIRVQLTKRDPSLDPECDVRGEHFPFSFFVQRAPSKGEAVRRDGTFRMGDSAAAGDVKGRTEGKEEEEEEEELGLYDQSIEVRADFVDGELLVDNVVFHGTFKTGSSCSKRSGNTSPEAAAATAAGQHDNTTGGRGKVEEVRYNNIFNGYPGPNLDEAEEEVLDGLQAWLAERCVDDQFGEFVGQYSVWVEQQEYEMWLKRLRDFVAA
ncbi:hypothetical protein, conserved [Trypanosoma brucei brucei TREU927]|uniref:Mitochondrial glycoprotein-like protein n=1 Tax=Trypanosoma brucei brucei (strain 927/4 GUTat10.1) TaxID=185431 RepID=Q57XS8_TRYB2|nr:hypothetical protein, conserved [Trypanosoma brucei brucei TREU927]AAX69591.1 hypothetical protein, conserved [Trypanosoma brucei]AAZ12769.1 hypothetical protein, conserved [Trypanosoma brucei brucei TREU927]